MKTTAAERYREWLNYDVHTECELRAIAGDEAEIEDRFGSDVAFGTAGIRGKMGAGTNRINLYTVRRATQGFAQFLKQGDPVGRKVVIAYDSRRNSKSFAEEAASVFAGNGFLVYLFDGVRSTPELSFAIRRLGADGGVMITASHNPPEYNGYKAYGSDGCQLIPEDSDRVAALYNAVEQIDYIPITHCLDTDIVKYVPPSVDSDYLELVRSVSVRPQIFRDTLVKAVFTPLHGVGGPTVRRLLESVGYDQVIYTENQMEPDGDFPTAPTPNPEQAEAYVEAKRCMRHQSGDLIIATDPDCDRMGLMLKSGKLLTGNQVAALYLEYILSAKREIAPGSYIVSTVVSGDLPKKVAESFGVQVREVLTGFKYIGKEIAKDPEHFIMGFEESCGYLFSPEIRDKDGVMATLLALEMSIYRNKNLEHVLRKLHRQHGTYIDVTDSLSFDSGFSIVEKMRIVRDRGIAGARKIDYRADDTALPKTDLVKFFFEDGSWVALRPSGTEPKLKVYYCVCAGLQKEAELRLQELRSAVSAVLNI